MKPFCSVIIPTLNEERFLPRLLTDLTKQTYKNFEVVVVDGESKDKTVETAEKFTNKLSLTIIRHKKSNVSIQRNVGARVAKGLYLVFFDADVRIPNNFLKELHSYVTKDHGFLFTTRLVSRSTSEGKVLLAESANFIIDLANRLGKPFAPGFNITIERQLFHKLGGFDKTLRLSEDHDIVQRARKRGVLLKILKDPVLYLSFRRQERVGYLESLTQYVIAGVYNLTVGPIKKDLFEYPMGGHLYEKNRENNKKIISRLREKLQKIARTIELPF